jgi:hypothetical protein
MRPKEIDMSNPWTTKNPFMSLWLSSANKVAGNARNQIAAAARREITAAQTEAARRVTAYWAGRKAPLVNRSPEDRP